jgi:hypothetical protein
MFTLHGLILLSHSSVNTLCLGLFQISKRHHYLYQKKLTLIQFQLLFTNVENAHTTCQDPVCTPTDTHPPAAVSYAPLVQTTHLLGKEMRLKRLQVVIAPLPVFRESQSGRNESSIIFTRQPTGYTIWLLINLNKCAGKVRPK